MSLATGDLTTPQRVATWLAAPPALPSAILTQLIGSMTNLIYSKLNRHRTYSQTFTRTFDGLGNMQLMLPDYPVTSITSVQQGTYIIPPSVIVPEGTAQPTGTNAWYGYRFIPSSGSPPGDPSVIELVGTYFYQKPQNVKITYQAGYLVQNEPGTVVNVQVTTIVNNTPTVTNYWQNTVLQPYGICCKDFGVTYANGTKLTAVAANPTVGQYVPPSDSQPGTYNFNVGDLNASILTSYSFVPADLEEACIQMVAERYNYRSRVGELSKSLGGQETMSYFRGNSGKPWNTGGSLPPEVMDLINPYISVIYPTIGAPL